jgi:hypothetical protein
MSNTAIDRAGFGPIEGQESVVPFNANLGTSAVEVTAQPAFLAAQTAYPGAQFWRVKIFNSSASATIAWGTGNDRSTMTADFAVTCGSHIAPGQAEYFAIQGSRSGVPLRKLWLVASAIGTSASVTFTPVG